MARHPFAILSDELWPVHRTSLRRVTFDTPDEAIENQYIRAVYVSDARELSNAHFILIPSTGGPDAFGRDLLAESNYRSLIRDFGEDVFITLAYMNRDDLMLPILPGDDWDDESDDYATANYLADAVRALFDYPIYDEGDYSEMECEVEAESWDEWLGYDVRYAIERAIHATDETLGDLAEEWLGNHDADLKDRFYSVRDANDLYWESDGQDIIYPDWETHTVPALVTYVLAEIGYPQD